MTKAFRKTIHAEDERLQDPGRDVVKTRIGHRDTLGRAGSIDLLMSEVLLPEMDGNELVRRARQTMMTLRAMLVSGMVATIDSASAADVFLPKGACSSVEILKRFASWLTGSVGRSGCAHVRVAAVAFNLL